MKKVRFMITAIVVMAVIGGALAFKTKAQNFCWFVKASPVFCPLVGNPQLTTDVGAGGQYVTTIPATGCPGATYTSYCSRDYNVEFD